MNFINFLKKIDLSIAVFEIKTNEQNCHIENLSIINPGEQTTVSMAKIDNSYFLITSKTTESDELTLVVNRSIVNTFCVINSVPFNEKYFVKLYVEN